MKKKENLNFESATLRTAEWREALYAQCNGVTTQASRPSKGENDKTSPSHSASEAPLTPGGPVEYTPPLSKSQPSPGGV